MEKMTKKKAKQITDGSVCSENFNVICTPIVHTITSTASGKQYAICARCKRSYTYKNS